MSHRNIWPLYNLTLLENRKITSFVVVFFRRGCKLLFAADPLHLLLFICLQGVETTMGIFLSVYLSSVLSTIHLLSVILLFTKYGTPPLLFRFNNVNVHQFFFYVCREFRLRRVSINLSTYLLSILYLSTIYLSIYLLFCFQGVSTMMSCMSPGCDTLVDEDLVS